MKNPLVSLEMVLPGLIHHTRSGKGITPFFVELHQSCTLEDREENRALDGSTK